jgi:hypothetical protein
MGMVLLFGDRLTLGGIAGNLLAIASKLPLPSLVCLGGNKRPVRRWNRFCWGIY